MPEVTARGMRFNVARMGSGARNIVFVHGLVIDNLASYYLSIAPPIAAYGRLLLYDLRGHGHSEQPPSGYTTDDMVADLIALLDAEGLAEPVTLVGGSFGGQIAVRTAMAHPSRVAALALIDPQLVLPDARSFLPQVFAATPEEQDRVADEYMGQWLANNAAVREAAAGSATPPPARAATLDAVKQRQKQRRSRFVRNTVSLLRDTTLVEDLARAAPIEDADLAAIRCPTLVIYGEHSDVRERDEPRLVRLMPQLEVVVVPNTGHTLLLEAPRAVRDAIAAWLARAP
jgi:pimeloyl-ACP methyl ester carboxylesterase